MGMCAVAGKKTMRHYADGGEIDPEMQKQIDANKAKYNPTPKQGLFSGLFGGSAPKPQTAPPAQAPTGMIGAIQNRNDELKKAANYANGGVVKPTIVVPDNVDMNAYTPEPGSGRGAVDAAGRVVDSLPYAAAQFVPGLNVPLGLAAAAVHAAQGRTEELPIDAASTLGGKGAGVLLQKGRQLQNAIAKQAIAGGIGRTANTVQALGAADAFGAPAYANGGKIKGPGTPTSDSIPAEVKQTGEQIKVSTGERVVSAEQDGFLQHVARKMGFESLDAMLEAGTGKPVGPTMKGGMAHAGSGAKPKEEGWGEGYGGKLTTADIVGTPNNNGLLGAEGVPHPSLALQSGSPAAPVAQTTPEAVPVAPSATSSPAPTSLVQAALHQQGPAQNANLDQGLNTQVNAGVIRQGNSFTGTGPNVKEDMSKPLTSIDLNANNAGMAKTNAIRQEMIDSQAGYRAEPGSSGGRIADSGRAEGDALLDKWGRESAAKDAMQMAANNPRAAQAIASTYGANVQGETALARDATDQMRNESNNATLRRGQDTRLQETGMQGAVTKRGQDIGERTHMAQIAGNPVTNDLTRAQTGLAQAGLDDKKRNQAMIDEINKPATDPKRRELLHSSLMAATGKSASERYVPQHKKNYNEMGQVVSEDVMMFDPATKQYITPGQGQQAGPHADPRAVAIRDNTKLSREEKKQQLAALGYK